MKLIDILYRRYVHWSTRECVSIWIIWITTKHQTTQNQQFIKHTFKKWITLDHLFQTF